MPQNAPLVLDIGGTSVTFNPTGIDSNNVASFRNRTPTQLVLQPVVTVAVDEPRAGGRDTVKGVVKITVPRTEIGSNSTEVIKNDLIKVEMVTGAKATKEDRVYILNALLATLSDTSVEDSLCNPEHFW